MAHARRKFEKALGNDKARAEYALGRIGELCRLERNCDQREVPPEVRHRYRRRWALPILKELEGWLKQEINVVAPKSPIGEAIAYALGLWPRLCARLVH